MKLLKTFRQQVKEIGPVRRAWFTTFGMNLELVEKYVLPALVGADVPVTLSDYEQVQAQAFPDDEDQEPIDIRIFHDARAGAAEKVKSTSVSLFPVDFRIAPLQRNEEILRGGFFHPKVIYLEGDNGTVIGAGSANLTIGAWARNREVFEFRKLKGHDNRQEVTKFFKRVHAWCGLKDDFSMPPVPRDERNPQDWRFVASTGQESFLDLLTKGIALKERPSGTVTVWSPFLAEDLEGLAREMARKHDVERLAVVGDRHPAGRIRLSEEAARAFLEKGHSLLQEPDFDWVTCHSHAKAWVSRRHVAVGSWNLTGPATGLSRSKRNVEAGFVLFGKGGDPEGLSELDLSNSLRSAEELRQETEDWLQEMTPPPVPVSVLFDWRSRRWSWNLPELFRNRALSPQLFLPIGETEPMRIDLVEQGEGELQVASLSLLLRSRTVQSTYLDKGARRSWPVWIQELHPQERPIARFDRLDDLLAALIQGMPESGNGLVMQEELPENLTDPLQAGSDGENALEGKISAFRLFAALKQARRLLEAAENPTALRRRVQVYPGCVTEIVERVGERHREDAGVSPVLRWFAVQELRLLVRTAARRWKELASQDEVAPDFAAIRKRIPALPALGKDERLQDFLAYATGKAGYR